MSECVSVSVCVCVCERESVCVGCVWGVCSQPVMLPVNLENGFGSWDVV